MLIFKMILKLYIIINQLILARLALKMSGKIIKRKFLKSREIPKSRVFLLMKTKIIAWMVATTITIYFYFVVKWILALVSLLTKRSKHLKSKSKQACMKKISVTKNTKKSVKLFNQTIYLSN